MDWSLIIAIAALAVSVLSPTLTAIVNHHFAQKSKRIEFDEQHRIAAIERYFHSAGLFTGSAINENAAAYWASCGEMYLYTPSALWHYIDDVSDAVAEYDRDRVHSTIAAFSKELSANGLAPTLRIK